MRVLDVNDDFPIRTNEPVHSGKVRSVYWLSDADSARLIQERDYPVAADSRLAIMIISDRLSAFECMWKAEGGLNGVPGKGAALNAISGFWFDTFKSAGLARSHILEVPHPLVWIVQRAEPVMIEAIARQYITGSMWRSYDKGERDFCGIAVPEGLTRDQKLPELLITPSTKGILSGIPGVPEVDDVNISRDDITNNWQAFKFDQASDVAVYEELLLNGFNVISRKLSELDQIFVDTKFEFGYAHNASGGRELIYMDEVGTPDSSRIWDGSGYRNGKIVENSKEGFRQALLAHAPDSDVLTNKARMDERFAYARETVLPASMMMDVSATYVDIAERITGKTLQVTDNPREEIIAVLGGEFGLIQ
jgi:phosphoribosylaminoimidazole-succinocarboxamide synthase